MGTTLKRLKHLSCSTKWVGTLGNAVQKNTKYWSRWCHKHVEYRSITVHCAISATLAWTNGSITDNVSVIQPRRVRIRSDTIRYDTMSSTWNVKLSVVSIKSGALQVINYKSFGVGPTTPGVRRTFLRRSQW